MEFIGVRKTSLDRCSARGRVSKGGLAGSQSRLVVAVPGYGEIFAALLLWRI